MKAFTDNPLSLADNILWLLEHPDHAQQLKERAWKDVQEIYNWQKIAAETVKVYKEVYEEYLESDWRPVTGEEEGRNEAMARMVKVMDGDEVSRYREIH